MNIFKFIVPHCFNIHRAEPHYFSLKTQKLALQFAFSCFLFVTLQAILRVHNKRDCSGMEKCHAASKWAHIIKEKNKKQYINAIQMELRTTYTRKTEGS